MKFVDLLLYSEDKITDFNTLYERHRSNLGYLEFLPASFQVLVIQHAHFTQDRTLGKIRFKIIKGTNKKWRIPFSVYLELRRLAPDVILVHSMVFSWQIFFLGLLKNQRTKILVQNHAEQPGGVLRRNIERTAAQFIDGFLFVNKTQALPWEKLGIIVNSKKVFEVMEGSTYFKADTDTKHAWGPNFLWVGRLNTNKDPLTVLKAFLVYSRIETNAKLKMIYNGGDLLSMVERFIQENHLSKRVTLMANIPHPDMLMHYRSADYFILGSHFEAGGYALCEAMACGCVPIVTEIPSFSMMVENGSEGYLFPPGDDAALSKILSSLNTGSHQQFKVRTIEKFEDQLSFHAIAKKIARIAEKVAPSC